MHITDIFNIFFLAERKTGYVLAIQQSQEIISFAKQVTLVSIVISKSKSTFVAILSLRFRLMVPPSIKMTVFYFGAFIIRLPNFSFCSGTTLHIILAITFSISSSHQKNHIYFFSKIKNKKVRDSFISAKSLYVDVRITENQEAKFSRSSHYKESKTINPIFIGNRIGPFSVFKKKKIQVYINFGYFLL